jgi:23S rRNA pseudouridine1911/1915/1917 synthase
LKTDYIKILVSGNDLGKRIDVILSKNLEDISRSRIQNLILEGKVSCNNQVIKNRSLIIKEVGYLEINVPEPLETSIKPQKIKLNILYEDEDLIVINKDAGLVVHPGSGNFDNTLVNGLVFHCKNSLSGIGGVLRPGIVHRIDKMTSGVMVIAKNDITHNQLSKQFKDRTIERKYICLTWNNLNLLKGQIDKNIKRSKVNRKKMTICSKNEGKVAITEYELKEKFNFKNLSLCLYECKLQTGRTHQIRVHFHYMKAPLIGDNVYKKNFDTLNLPQIIRKNIEKNFILPKRQALHAKTIGFFHPKKKKFMLFKSEIPNDISSLLKNLNDYN